MPNTLNCQPTSSTVRALPNGTAAPMASDAHGDVGRCRRRDADTTPSIAPERTAAGGAPMRAT